MRYYFTVFICKIFIFVLRCLGKKATSAPGKLAFRLYPDILRECGKRLNGKIIAVMGTNGKTTTNNLLADCFEKSGKRVACNRIGANMDEGALVAFLDKTTLFGKLKADCACLEMDEGWAEYILNFITPDIIVVGNLFRDQLDRYGEIETTMGFIKKAIEKAPNATLLLNADDPLTVALAKDFKNEKKYFGIKNAVKTQTDNIKENTFCPVCSKPLKYNFYQFSQLGDWYCDCSFKRPEIDFSAENISLFPEIRFDVKETTLSLNTRGIYNVYNALAVVSCAYLCEIDCEAIKKAFNEYVTQTGRMQSVLINHKKIYLILAKNPTGFNQSVYSVLEDDQEKDIVICINDMRSDGRDVSWLWDVDFESLKRDDVLSYTTSGTRYADMALRLKYAGIDSKDIKPAHNLKPRLKELISITDRPLYILANYTALYETEKLLKEMKNNEN